MAADRFMLGFPRLLIVLAVAGMLLFTASSAQAQSHQGPEGTQDRPANGPTHTSQLPDWAEPATPSSKRTTKKEGGGIKQEMETRQPELPGDPEQVPVDGGVALLAVAGAGYAVRKLNEEDEDDEPA